MTMATLFGSRTSSVASSFGKGQGGPRPTIAFFGERARRPRDIHRRSLNLDSEQCWFYIFVDMANQTQISAYISKTTKSLVEEYTEHHGVKKAHLVEEALLHHIQALREVPVDLLVPPRVLVSRDTGAAILDKIERPRKPTKAMRELFAKQ